MVNYSHLNAAEEEMSKNSNIQPNWVPWLWSECKCIECWLRPTCCFLFVKFTRHFKSQFGEHHLSLQRHSDVHFGVQFKLHNFSVLYGNGDTANTSWVILLWLIDATYHKIKTSNNTFKIFVSSVKNFRDFLQRSWQITGKWVNESECETER